MKYLIAALVTAGMLIACHPDMLEMKSQRKFYKQSLVQDERSPLEKADLKHLDFFPPDANYRIKARFTHTPEAKTFEMPTYSGVTRTYRQYGTIDFTWQRDMRLRLAVYENIAHLQNPIYKDHLVLPFKDATSGKATYGGGRYMNLSKADVDDGEVLLDFNTCYNPWCAYSEGFNCPIPPAENNLSIAVQAGEKKYKGKVKTVPQD